METKYKDLTIAKTKDLGEGVVEAIVATNDLDRHNERLSIEGLDIKEYMKNPIVAWGHKYDIPSIGKTLSLKKDGNKLIAKMQFAVGISDLATEVYQLIKGGFMNAFSIGFIPEEMEGNTYVKSKMIEYSAVLIPANSRALALAKQKGIKTDLVMKALEEHESNNLINLPKEVKKMSVKDLQNDQPVEEVVTPAEESVESNEPVEEVVEEAAIEKMIDAKVEAKLAEMDAVKVKNINTKNVVVNNQYGETKEARFKEWLVALSAGDFAKARTIVKATSTMDTTNTSAVIAPEEFLSEVWRLEESFGVAERYANVRRVNANSLRGVKGDEDVVLYRTDELGVKQSSKLTYDPYTLEFIKFAGIMPLADELEQDSDVNLWNDATQRFARRFAQAKDQLVFTDATSGIVNTSGVATVTIGGDSIEDITFDDLSKAIFAVPGTSGDNGRFYFNRTILGVLQRIKDIDNNYILRPGANGPMEGTLWGRPYVLTEVLPALSADADDTAFMVYGDLRYTTLGVRNMMEARIFDTGIVLDPDGETDLNLLTQDAKALRVVQRFNSVNVLPNAYAVIKTQATAS